MGDLDVDERVIVTRDACYAFSLRQRVCCK
jgi:hypothetical protein